MTEYLIYRHGSNAANQSMCQVAPIAIVRARSRTAAARTVLHGTPSLYNCPVLEPDGEILARAGDLNVWANQCLDAVPRSKVPKADWNEMLDIEALAQAYQRV